jgi:hypothetical protein
MVSALIGHTGFVGSNLARQMHFDEFYNSKNIEEIRGRSFDLVVCAGAPGAKWYANAHPREDYDSIAQLVSALRNAEIRTLILISTIDAIIAKDAYGENRRFLEIVNLHRGIVRLPALFGLGLKKNALYDLMRGKRLDEIAPNATYQWYPLRRLAVDINRVNGEVNFTSDPIAMSEIRDRFFPGLEIGPWREDAPSYNVEGDPAFRLSKAEVFGEMEAFLAG